MNWKTALVYLLLAVFAVLFILTVDLDTAAVDVMDVLKEHNPLADNNPDGR
jgi:hypothetical protein